MNEQQLEEDISEEPSIHVKLKLATPVGMFPIVVGTMFYLLVLYRVQKRPKNQ